MVNISFGGPLSSWRCEEVEAAGASQTLGLQLKYVWEGESPGALGEHAGLLQHQKREQSQVL